MKSMSCRKVYLFFSSLLIFMIHLPVTFAKSKSAEEKNLLLKSPVVEEAKNRSFAFSAAVLYDSLKLNMLGLSQKAYQYAIDGLVKLKEQGAIINDDLISIVDFTKSSAQKRLYVIDLEHHQLLFNTYVAHGQNSGKEFANRFSNAPESFQSSLGFYETSETYQGKNGYSMHLTGLEKGINDKADQRAIVMHGAPYVSESFIRSQGYIGRSWGCPAVPEKLTRPIIDKIKNGTCLFIFSENKNYLRRSKILNS